MLIFDQTSSAIAEIDDGPHGTSTHYIITKPQFFDFQNFFKTNKPTDRQTDRQTKSPIKTATRRLKTNQSRLIEETMEQNVQNMFVLYALFVTLFNACCSCL